MLLRPPQISVCICRQVKLGEQAQHSAPGMKTKDSYTCVVPAVSCTAPCVALHHAAPPQTCHSGCGSVVWSLLQGRYFFSLWWGQASSRANFIRLEP